MKDKSAKPMTPTPSGCCRRIVRAMRPTALGKKHDSVVVMLPVSLFDQVYALAKIGSNTAGLYWTRRK